MKLIGRIVCFVVGHKRGRLVPDMPLGRHSEQTRVHIYACPRCDATWMRKIKQRTKPMHPGNNGAPTDGSAHFQEAT